MGSMGETNESNVWTKTDVVPVGIPQEKLTNCGTKAADVLVIFLGETRMRFALLGWASFRSFVRSTRNQLLKYLENGLT